ncbi:MAG: VOC family protein [Pseudomonadota bacterium]|nr:VOC family protein [Pseudomonadota bacterium]
MRVACIALLAVGLLAGCEQDRDAAKSTTWVAEESQAPAAAAAETANDASAEAAALASKGFVWHELLSPAPEAAADFYTFVFDWSRDDTPAESSAPYIRLRAADTTFAGVISMAVYDFSGPARWTGWIAVETPADALDGAERDGGLILKRDVEHPRGRLAFVQDPAGAELGLIDLRPELGAVPGPIVAHELLLDRPAEDAQFYQRWLKWPAPQTRPSGALEFSTPAGPLRFAPPASWDLPSVAPSWVPVFAVDDFEAVRDRAVEAGAVLVRELKSAEDGARSARLRDPQGAPFMIRQRAGTL